MQKDFDLPILKFHIHKNIPFGAGLGGGSANAAATLLELNKFYKLNISEEKMLLYAQKLGSDCAFFIKNKTVYAEQKGDIFSYVFRVHIVRTHPEHCNTIGIPCNKVLIRIFGGKGGFRPKKLKK